MKFPQTSETGNWEGKLQNRENKQLTYHDYIKIYGK
jgi:hypothetical protein